jgi:hypothetical protein
MLHACLSLFRACARALVFSTLISESNQFYFFWMLTFAVCFV